MTRLIKGCLLLNTTSWRRSVVVLCRLYVHPCTHSGAGLESSHRVSSAPVVARRETRVSQVPGSSSSLVPCFMTPPAVAEPLPVSGFVTVALRHTNTLDNRNVLHFMGCIQTWPKHSRNYASPLGYLNGARLATDWWGCTLFGRVSPPLDDELNFIGSSHHPLLPDQPCLVTLVFTIPDCMAAMFVILHPYSLSSFA